MVWLIWLFLTAIYIVLFILELSSQKESPQISVLLLVKNGEEVIEGVVRDIERLSKWRQGMLELVVVDCYSEDRSSFILRGLKRQGLIFTLAVMESTEAEKEARKLCHARQITTVHLPEELTGDVHNARKIVYRVWRESRKIKYRSTG